MAARRDQLAADVVAPEDAGDASTEGDHSPPLPAARATSVVTRAEDGSHVAQRPTEAGATAAPRVARQRLS